MSSISTWNACLGINNKKDIIEDYLQKNITNILCIQEGEIDILNLSYYNIKNYNFIYSNCKPKARTCIYVKDKIDFKRLSNFENDTIELICIKFYEFVLVNYYQTFAPKNNVTLFDDFINATNLLNTILTNFPNKHIRLL